MPSDVESFRRGDSVLRNLHAHLLRRDSFKQRMANPADHRRNINDSDHRLQYQSQQTQMVKNKNLWKEVKTK